jgi:hypothetical protein
MVCRDAVTHKARKVNPLVLESVEDRALFAIGEGWVVGLCMGRELMD